MLSVRGGTRAVEFYKQAFGAVELLRIGESDSHIVAKLSAGGAEFWIADESPEYLNFSPDALNGTTVRLILIVEDPDTAFAQAVNAGARVIYPVEDHHYGWRDGRVADPFGHHWEIGKPLT